MKWILLLIIVYVFRNQIDDTIHNIERAIGLRD